MQSMDSRRQGRGYRRVHILTGPRAGTVQIIPAPPVQSFDYLFDEDLAAALFDDDDYLAPAHGSSCSSSSSSKRSRVAATSEAILSLHEVTGSSRSGDECAVCLQGFRADETLRAMPCSHAFHQHCISEWLRRNAVCPLCRCGLPEPEEDKQRRRISLGGS